MNGLSALLLVPWSILAVRYALSLKVPVFDTVAYCALWCVVFWPLSQHQCMDSLHAHLTPHYRNKQRLREFTQTFGPVACALAAIGMHCSRLAILGVFGRLYAWAIGFDRRQFMLHAAMAILSRKEFDWYLRGSVYAIVVACRFRLAGPPGQRHLLALVCHLWVVGQDEDVLQGGLYGKVLVSVLMAVLFVMA